MQAPLPDLDTAELRSRTTTLQTGMRNAGIDALLLTTEPDVRYVSGFLTRFRESPTRPWLLVVAAPGEPVAVVPAISAAPRCGRRSRPTRSRSPSSARSRRRRRPASPRPPLTAELTPA
jgi:Xaa-Pro aminopeptidase